MQSVPESHRVESILPANEVAKVDQHVFDGGEAMSNAEISILLKHYQDSRSGNQITWQPPPAVKKTQDYVSKFSAVIDNETILTNMRQKALYEWKLKQFEYVQLVNLMPESAEEAETLLPSLKDPERFPDDTLAGILAELETMRAYQ